MPMLLSAEWLQIWLRGSWGALFATVFAGVYFLLNGLPVRAPRWVPWVSLRKTALQRTVRVLARYALVPASGRRFEERSDLLLGAGIRLDPFLYETLRRMGLAACACLLALAYAGYRMPKLVPIAEPIYVMTAGGAGLVLLWADRKLLEQLKLQRSRRIVKEIYMLCNQLLYFNGSKMSLHHKLTRCVPHTRTIRQALQRMLNEWYQDASQAIRNFQRALGTDESHSLAETLQALRLHDHESYYALLRQRIADYKEKLELARDSRKETVSYVLFVLAGLPILNTFRVFMYPWIMEGQKLFQSLN
jgi:hypothetical protein